MRLICCILSASIAAVASADRLIDIPTARKVPDKDVRYEFRAQPFAGGAFEHYLGIGVGNAYELDLRDVSEMGGNQVGTFDFAYNFISAIPGVSPGISMGFQDAANQTTDGRRAYIVTTFREPMQVIGDSVKADITLGVQTGRLTSPLVGVSMPFSQQVFFLVEHSGYRLNTGIEIRLAPNIAFRYVIRGGSQTLLSLSAQTRF